MKKVKSLFTLCLVALLATVAMTSCDDEQKTPGGTAQFAALVTFVSSNDQGSVFVAQENNESSPVTLTSPMKIDKPDANGLNGLNPGERCIIYYSNDSGKPFQAGSIRIYTIRIIANGKILSESMAEIRKGMADPIRVSNVERIGQYVNVFAKAPFNSEAKQFIIAVDEATVNDEVPQAYVLFKSDNAGVADREIIGSFDISSVWNLSTCKGLTIHYKDGEKDASVSFAKGGISIRPTE